MSEFISSPPFLIIAAIFGILLIIGIVKRAVRLLICVTVIFIILIGLGIMKQFGLLSWFENMFKVVE